jgi:galactose mutarotase-like enzyme
LDRDKIMTDIVRLICGNDVADVHPLGAEAIAWKVKGNNLLWTADPGIWPRTSPVLFPIVGRARNGYISVGGRSYPMGIHGFAASSLFAVIDRTKDSVLLRLVDNDTTRAAFPFPFRLDIGYRLAPGSLTVSFLVGNPGTAPLPYALGLHPGFVWPFTTGERDDYRIEFEHAEPAEVPVITSEGLFSSKPRPVPMNGRSLQLSGDLMAREALCFLGARSRWIRFVAPDGAAIRMETENFSHFALWSRPGAPFLSMEGWTGHGDPDGFQGDISEKPSMRLLAPGAVERHEIRITYEAAG